MDLAELYTTTANAYKKDTDQDFPTNKIRFFMDFLWNATISKPLTDDQKASLKNLIDLLNALDDHKLSPTRDIIGTLSTQLSPLLATYPSLGHTFTFVVTTLLPAYQKYLTSLENQVKEAHPFTKEEVLLYYDMTLVDHAVLSHVFESEPTLNLVEVITAIKTVIVVNALTHDYLQDAMGRSISLFTFLQRGGLAKEKCKEFYQELVASLIATMKESVTNKNIEAAVEELCKHLAELTNQPTPEVALPQDTPSVEITPAQVDAATDQAPAN